MMLIRLVTIVIINWGIVDIYWMRPDLWLSKWGLKYQELYVRLTQYLPHAPHQTLKYNITTTVKNYRNEVRIIIKGNFLIIPWNFKFFIKPKSRFHCLQSAFQPYLDNSAQHLQVLRYHQYLQVYQALISVRSIFFPFATQQLFHQNFHIFFSCLWLKRPYLMVRFMSLLYKQL